MKVSDRCLIDIGPRVLAIRDVSYRFENQENVLTECVQRKKMKNYPET